jgi:Leucine-rich repeat (LRR) protein
MRYFLLGIIILCFLKPSSTKAQSEKLFSIIENNTVRFINYDGVLLRGPYELGPSVDSEYLTYTESFGSADSSVTVFPYPIIENNKMILIDDNGNPLIDDVFDLITFFGDTFLYNDSLISLDNNEVKVYKDEKTRQSIIIGSRKGKVGVLNRAGNKIIPFKYEQIIWNEYSSSFLVRQGSLWGVYDRSGQPLTSFEFDFIGDYWQNEFLYTIQRNGLWGLMDFEGKIIVEPAFNEPVTYLQADFLLTKNAEGKFGIYSSKANLQLLPNEYNYIGHLGNGRYELRKNAPGVENTYFYNPCDELHQIYDLNKQVFLTADQYCKMDQIEKVWVAQNEDSAFIYNSDFKILLKAEKIEPFYNKRYLKFEVDGMEGVFDANSQSVLIGPLYKKIEYDSERESFEVITSDYKVGLFDTTGRIVLSAIYNRIYANQYCSDKGCGLFSMQSGLLTAPIYDDILIDLEGPENIVLAKQNEAFFMLAADGTVLCKMDEPEVKWLNEYSAIGIVENGAYLYDLTGKKLNKTPLNFQEMDDFGPCEDGDCFIYEGDGKQGILFKNGKLTEPVFEDFWTGDLYSHPYLIVQQNGLFGVIDFEGNYLVKPIYESIERIIHYQNGEEAHRFIVVLNGNIGLLDQNGQTILEPKYKHIGSEYNFLRVETDSSVAYLKENNLEELKISLVPNAQIVELSAYKPQVIFTTSQKTGVADLNGKVLIPAVYDEITYAHGNWITGVYQVKQNNKIGFVDSLGKQITPCICDDVEVVYTNTGLYSPFESRYFFVCFDGAKRGILNSKAERVVLPTLNIKIGKEPKELYTNYGGSYYANVITVHEKSIGVEYQGRQLAYIDSVGNFIWKSNTSDIVDMTAGGLINWSICCFDNLRTFSNYGNDWDYDFQLPDCFFEIQSIEKINLVNTDLDSFPSKFSGLRNLHFLFIGSQTLVSLPSEFGSLSKLDTLDLRSSAFASLPANFGSLVSLDYLSLQAGALNVLPESFGELNSLNTLFLDAPQLNALPESMGQLQALRYFYLSSDVLASFPNSMVNLDSLKHLSINLPATTEFPDFILGLEQLDSLYFYSSISIVPVELGQMKSLSHLTIKTNHLPAMPYLQSLNLTCESLDESIKNFVQLNYLCINGIYTNSGWDTFWINVTALDNLEILDLSSAYTDEYFDKTLLMYKNQIQQMKRLKKIIVSNSNEALFTELQELFPNLEIQ